MKMDAASYRLAFTDEQLAMLCAHYDKRIDELAAENDQLIAENEKMRELCVKALGWLRWAGGITCPPEVPDEFEDELRKLGIEVE